MAGDWLKVEENTPHKPEITILARLLGIDQGNAFLAWFNLYVWLGRNTSDGNVRTLSGHEIDTAAQTVLGTTDTLAMPEIGWLVKTGDGYAVREWDRHNSKNAKARAGEALRKRLQRNDGTPVTKEMSGHCPDKCPGESGTSVRTREEKRREKEATNVASCAPTTGFSFPLSTGKVWDLPAKKLLEYHATHDGKLDVEYELRKARQWLMDHKDGRPRSSRGIQRFLTGWLNRCNDRKQLTLPGSTVAATPDGEGRVVYDAEGGRIVRALE